MKPLDRISFRISVILAGMPLVAGIMIFVAWLITRQPWLMTAGAVTVYAGIGLVASSAVALTWFFIVASREAAQPGRSVLWAVACGAGLIVIDFMTAIGMISAAVALETKYVIVVHNESSRPVYDAKVAGGCVDVGFGTIPPGASVKRTFWVKCDGSLGFSGKIGGANVVKIVSGYVTCGQRGREVITITPGEQIVISHGTDT